MSEDFWEKKLGKKPWDPKEEIVDETPEEDQIQEYEPESKTIFKPTKDTGYTYLIIASVLAALGISFLILFGKDEKEEVKEISKVKVPKIITKTVTKFVERPAEPKAKETVIKEETEEKEEPEKDA